MGSLKRTSPWPRPGYFPEPPFLVVDLCSEESRPSEPGMDVSPSRDERLPPAVHPIPLHTNGLPLGLQLQEGKQAGETSEGDLAERVRRERDKRAQADALVCVSGRFYSTRCTDCKAGTVSEGRCETCQVPLCNYSNCARAGFSMCNGCYAASIRTVGA